MHRVEATPVEDSDDLKNQKNYSIVRGPNPCYTPMLDATICELSFVWCFSDHHKIKLVSSKLLFVLCVSLPTSLLSHPKTLGPSRWWMKLDWYSLDRKPSRRQSYGFRTWRITSGAIWFQGRTKYRTLFSTLKEVLQHGGICIKLYRDGMEQGLGKNSRRLWQDHVLSGSTMTPQEINLVPARFAEK